MTVELFVLILREVVRLGIVPQHVLAAGDRLDPGEDFDHRRFACSVYPYQRDPVAALDNEIGPAEYEVIAVGLGYILELRDDASARLRLGKAEMDGLLVGRDVDLLD